MNWRQRIQRTTGIFALVASFALVPGCVASTRGRLYVQVGPPRPIVEVRVAPPGPGYVWIGGYHRWDGRAYVWIPGRYERRPHARAVWRPAHWETRGRRHVWIEGRFE